MMRMFEDAAPASAASEPHVPTKVVTESAGSDAPLSSEAPTSLVGIEPDAMEVAIKVAQEVADLHDIDLLLRRYGQQSIIKVYPDVKNRSQFTVCFACGTSQEHRGLFKWFGLTAFLVFIS